MPLQGVGKGRFDRRLRLRVVHRLEAGAPPGGSVAFGDEGAHRRPVTVVMRVHRPGWRIDERLAQRLEGTRRAVPDEAVGQELDARAERRLGQASHNRVDTVGADDQVVPGQLGFGGHGAPVFGDDPDRRQPMLQQLQQRQPADCREPDAVDDHALAAVEQREIGPSLQRRSNQTMGLLVVVAQEVERTIGEDDAEAESRIGVVLLDDPDVVPRLVPLHEVRQVEARWSGANDQDLQRGWSCANFAAMISRSSRFRILPTGLSGSSAAVSSRSGSLKAAICCARRKAISSAKLNVSPGCGTTKAHAFSPNTGSGIATSADSFTFGWVSISASISSHEIFSPPRLTKSLSRPSAYRYRPRRRTVSPMR